MKNIIGIIYVFFSFANSSAQMKHSISINHLAYGNTFTLQKEPLFEHTFNLFLPALEYKIERKKSSFSAYHYQFYKKYTPAERRLYEYWNMSFGVNYGYRLFKMRTIELTGFAGLNYSWNKQREIIRIYPSENIMGGIEEWDIGLQSGLNAKAYFWKGIFMNLSLRYNYYPFQSKSTTNQNLSFEIGLGYRF